MTFRQRVEAEAKRVARERCPAGLSRRVTSWDRKVAADRIREAFSDDYDY